MATPIRRLSSLLRSRRLAVAMIALVACYGILGTLIPQGGSDSPEVVTWALLHPVAAAVAAPLGMYTAYTSPFFFAVVLLLAASTTACALERTHRATRLARSLASALSAAVVERLDQRPQAIVPVLSSDSEDVLMARVSDRLRSRGLRVTREGSWASGRAGTVGLAGSPLFHWSLVLLMFVTAAGQATRAEGFLALPLSERVAEIHESYLQIKEGPWFGEGHTGVVLQMTELDRDYISDGVDYGPTPYVEASRAGAPIAQGWVHPNSPLQVGSLMIHMAAFGPSVTLAVESVGGAEIARETFPLDLSDETSSGTTPQMFDLTTTEGQAGLTARVQVLVKAASGASPDETRALIETATAGATGFSAPVIVPVGSALDLAGGGRLRVVSVTDWARVSVANDWSVPFIYGFLVLAVLGLGVAVLVPARRASVLLVETEVGRFLHIGTWHDRRDPLYMKQILNAVTQAAAPQEDQ